MPIRVLDPTVAAQIAAGEVVERPASVVKELVENALDAGARRVTVGVRGGGIDELLIQDDGRGIPADEIELAFARHATSKLSTADDLWAIQTLGFRGEALPSIAAIAQVICASRTADAPMGVELRIAGGEIQAIAPRGGAVGTTFTIRNLFYNVPVRREFLKSPAAKSAAVATVVTQYALAYPQIAFTLLRDGKRVVQTSGRGQLADVVLELYGVDVARQMLPVEGRGGEDLGLVEVRGLVSAPTLSRGGRDGMHLTVNGRAIQPRGQLGAIVEEAYQTLLMKGRFPLVVLQVQVHPAAVDVNVHPTKSEVKFRQPQHIARVLGQAVRSVVQGTAVVQGWAEPSAPSQGVDVDQGDPAHAPPADRVSAPPAAAAELAGTADTQPAGREDGSAGWPDPAPQSEVRPVAQVEETEFIPPSPADPTPIQNALLTEHRGAGEARELPFPVAPRARAEAGVELDAPIITQAAGSEHAEQAPAPSVREAPAEPYSAPLPEQEPAAAEPAAAAPRLPPVRALAQLAQTYLLTEGPGGALYLIDQHAAHERVTYERLLARHRAGAVQAQALLLPQTINVPPGAQQALLAASDELASWGLALAEAEHGVEVRAVPAGLALDELATVLADLAGHLGGSGGPTPADRHDATLATLACHTSVRAGQVLSLVEQQALIDQLAGCDGPRTCPHGRPTLIVITQHQLERQFGRLGA
jgi:DNA mismatch repair protein MutL